MVWLWNHVHICLDCNYLSLPWFYGRLRWIWETWTYLNIHAMISIRFQLIYFGKGGPWLSWQLVTPGGCFTNVSRALLNKLTQICNVGNHVYGENFMLKHFVRVPKAWREAPVQSFSFELPWEVQFLQNTNLERTFWKDRETLVNNPQRFAEVGDK